MWQRDYLTGAKLKELTDYWVNQLEGFEYLSLPTDLPRPPVIDYSGESLDFQIDREVSIRLRTLAKNLNVSLYSLLLSGYYLMLHAYSNQDDIVVGSPASNRHYSQLSGLIGFFINSLVLRIKVVGNEKLSEFICKVGELVIQSQMHQDLPFEKLVERLQLEKDLQKHPVFQVTFEFANNRANETRQSLLELQAHMKGVFDVAKFDLSTFIEDTGDCLNGNITYAKSLYCKSTINGMLQTYQLLLNQLSELSANENQLKEKIINDLYYTNNVDYVLTNLDTQSPISSLNLVELFESQVAKSPDRIALIYEDIRLSYEELNNQANELSRKILARTKGMRGLIALCMEKSEQMLISILAVLKSGNAYVPIDPAYPKIRIDYILEDTNALLLLVDKDTQIQEQTTPILVVNAPYFSVENKLSENIGLDIKPCDLAYVIYTSGTTGKPKGVLIEHKSVVNLWSAMTSVYQMQQDERILFLTNYCFDPSVEQIILSLLNGFSLVIFPEKSLKDASAFHEVLKSYQVTHLDGTPTFLTSFEYNNLPYLRRIISGGERLTSSNISNFNQYKNLTLFNAYGLSETTVTSMVYKVKNSGYLGTPINNTKIHILNKALQPLPDAAIGELYISGVGLARGYLNLPELTKERFIQKSIGCDNRLYKTGDLVRILKNGEIEYLGRVDQQIKIRGQRIELQEIEAVLQEHQEIKESVVVFNNKKLLAYYIGELTSMEVLVFIKARLPEYMVPSFCIQVNSIPLTQNGNIDLKLLPVEFSLNDKNYCKPNNIFESKLLNIWQELLGIEKIGVNDDFFRIGGDSILSIRLISHMRKSFKKNVVIQDVFKFRTIRELCANMLATNSEHVYDTEQGLLTGEFELLPIQKWFFHQNLPNPNYWNQSFFVRVPALDLELLQESLEKLVCYHDMLRIEFSKRKNLYKQTYSTNKKIEIKTADVSNIKSNDELQKIVSDWQGKFSLSKSPIFSVGYIYGYKDGSTRLFFAFHHLIIDMISWRIIVEDLRTIYEGKNLAKKGSSYRQWVNCIKNYPKSYLLEAQYWKNVCKTNNEKPTYDMINSKFYNTFHELGTQETKLLIQNSNLLGYQSMNVVLLAALNFSLVQAWNKTSNLITLEGHGRENFNHNLDISRAVGWFTTMFPVSLIHCEDIWRNLRQINQLLKNIPNNGIGYGAIKELTHLPKICFNFLGEIINEGQMNKDWEITSENSGINSDEYNHDVDILSINARIIDGKFSFNIRAGFDKEIVDKLSFNFEQYLKTFIAKFANIHLKELSIADFPSFESYVEVNTDKNNLLFVFPPGNGGAESYLGNIANKLQNHRLILFNNYYLHLQNTFDKERSQNIDYEDLAKEYIILLKEIKPNGPYNLFGWSFGALMAFEVARQLILDNQIVTNLYLLDPFFAVNRYKCDIKNGLNCRYEPTPIKFEDTNIVLFKATKLVETIPKSYDEKAELEILNYLVQNIDDNGISHVIKETFCKIINIDSSHGSWVSSASDLDLITNTIEYTSLIL